MDAGNLRIRRLVLIDIRSGTAPAYEEHVMGDKSPKKDNSKKPAKSLKEKRQEKQAKRDGKRPGSIS